ncbi:MAG: glycosyltransferase family 4 protein [Spirochaetota bacterium]
MTRKKIGIISRPVDQGTSGSAFSLIHTLRAMRDIRSEWEDIFDIHLIHYVKGTHSLYESFPELIVPRNPLKAAWCLERERFELLHYNPVTIYSPVFGFSGRTVGMIHSAEPDMLPHLYSRIHVWHDRIVVPFLARRIDRIISPSNTTADYLLERMRLSKRPLVAHNAVSELFPAPPEETRRSKIRERFGLEEPFFFHISKYSERKNPWTLLEAFARLVEEVGAGLPHRLLIGGSGWDNEEVLAFLKRRNLGQRVVLAGFLDEAEVATLYAQAFAFVFPSLIEGFGMPNLEAMAYGCPVITSDAFAVREVVADAALVIRDPLDVEDLRGKMRRVIDDPALRQELISRGYERVRYFSWDKSARHTLDLYAELLGVERRWV